MTRYLNPLSLNKVFELKGPIQSVTSYISKTTPSGFSVIRDSNFEYKFLSDLSLGTLIKKSRAATVNGIQTKVVLTSVNKNTTVVTFTSKIRFELFLTLGAWVVVALFQLVGKIAIPLWVITVFFPILLIFFFLTYRLQEMALQSKAEAYLRQF